MSVLRIKSKRDGFRRGGVAHSSTATDWPLSAFSDSQLVAILGEPLLQLASVEADDQVVSLTAEMRAAAIAAIARGDFRRDSGDQHQIPPSDDGRIHGANGDVGAAATAAAPTELDARGSASQAEGDATSAPPAGGSDTPTREGAADPAAASPVSPPPAKASHTRVKAKGK